MKYDPVSTFSKLSAAGVKFDISDPLVKMVLDLREKKHPLKPSFKVPDWVDKLPDVVINKKGKPSRPLMEIPKQYMGDVLNFIGYLSSTASLQFKITFRNLVTGEGFIKYKPYVHRWTNIYRKSILAKMYQLEAYLGNEVSDLEFISLTAYQKDSNRLQNLHDLCEYRKKLLDLLRWKFGTIDYVWMFEPHESGYPHLHLVYFKKLTDAEKESLKKLWSEKYGMGSYDVGLKFSTPRASDNGFFVEGTIGRIRGYLMKYLAKGLNHDTESFHEYVINGKSVKLDMSLHELLFNSLLKKTKTRLWGCSRNFSKIMKRPEPEQSVKDWECIQVGQLYAPYDESETQEEREAHQVTVLWDKEAGLRPDSIKTWKLIESASSISQQLKEKADFNGWKIEYAPFLCISPKTGLKVGELSNYNIFEPVYSSINRSV